LIKSRKSFIKGGRLKQLDEVEQVNTESGRYYKTPSGVLYPSVTTVTGIMSRDAIAKWRQTIGEEEAKKVTARASARGTRIHQLCEDYISGSPIDASKYNFEDAANFEKLKPLLDSHLNAIWLQETRLYSNFLQMAGTVDCVAEWNGRLSIVDFKTARKQKEKHYIENYFCQATAYAIMYEELFDIPVDRIVIVISVDEDDPQVFESRRDFHVDKLLEVREEYRLQYGV